ncbi:MAG: hypothetical protein AB1529_02610 [Candidatus Micrarchaeota archaeon]
MPPRAKAMYSFGYTYEDMFPMLQMQRITQESVLSTYLQQSLMSESIIRRHKESEEASVMARALSEPSTKTQNNKEDRSTTSTYAITYYNPVLQQTEVLEAKTEIKTKDIATKMIEESVAAQSALPIYQFIAQPLIRKEVIPWKLEEILAEREYGTPPPPPAGAAVTPVRVIEIKEEEKAAEKRREEEAKSAIVEVVVRKEKSELKIGEELMLLEEAVGALRAGDEIDKVLERLPPLSRARFILAMRKKNLGRNALIQLLLQDMSFLKTIKKKLELFTLDDLLGMYKMLRQLQKR